MPIILKENSKPVAKSTLPPPPVEHNQRRRMLIALALLLLALIVIHLVAAIWHHVIKRDRVTARMVSGEPG